jgi:hypothetical protein
MAAQVRHPSSPRLDRVLEIVVSIAEQLDVPAARLAPAREISARTTTLGSVGSSGLEKDGE